MTISNVIKWRIFRRLVIYEYHNIYNHIIAIGETEDVYNFKEVYSNYIELSTYTQEIDFIENERQALFNYLDDNVSDSKTIDEVIYDYIKGDH